MPKYMSDRTLFPAKGFFNVREIQGYRLHAIQRGSTDLFGSMLNSYLGPDGNLQEGPASALSFESMLSLCGTYVGLMLYISICM